MPDLPGMVGLPGMVAGADRMAAADRLVKIYKGERRSYCCAFLFSVLSATFFGLVSFAKKPSGAEVDLCCQ
jgi:hypothetical protein